MSPIITETTSKINILKRATLKYIDPIYNNNDEDKVSFNFSLEETDDKQSMLSMPNNEICFEKSSPVIGFSQKYEIVELLGKGRFGIVYLV